MLAARRAAVAQRALEHLLRNSRHEVDLAPRPHEGPNVEFARSRVGVARHPEPVPAQDPLDLLDVVGEPLGRNGGILDEGQRNVPVPPPEKKRHRGLPHGVDEALAPGILNGFHGRQARRAAQPFRGGVQRAPRLLRGPLEGSDQP